MRRWKLTYRLETEFSSPVREHHYTLRCFPQERQTQKTASVRCAIRPEDGGWRGTDAFGNRMRMGTIAGAHDAFGVTMEALVDTAGEPEPEDAPVEALARYRVPTRLTGMGAALEDFRRACCPGADALDARSFAARTDGFSRADFWMNALGGRFRYQTGSTGFDTTAEAAFAQGCGVCQDYAHILLALLRREGIAARYAAGAIPGEGETHAWVEVWQDGFWRGFDPTHSRSADAEYICMTVGRDAADCPVCRGIFRGSSAQRQTATVIMEEWK